LFIELVFFENLPLVVSKLFADVDVERFFLAENNMIFDEFDEQIWMQQNIIPSH
jgi:hypothetical protein